MNEVFLVFINFKKNYINYAKEIKPVFGSGD